MGRFKLLYEDLKPNEKLGEIALEVLRSAPLVKANTVIATLFEAKFDLDKCMEILNEFLDIVLKPRFHGLDKVERAVGLGIDWEEVLEIKSLFPRSVKNLWVHDARHEDITHYRKVLDILRSRFGNSPRKLVEQFIQKCDVFKVKDDLYIVCVLFLCAGWKTYVVKGGKLVRETEIGVFSDYTRWRSIWPYHEMFEEDYPELPKITHKVFETWCKSPDDLLVINGFKKNLAAERRDNRVLMCTMTLDAGWEAVEYVKTIRDDKSVKRIIWWDAPEVWELWYRLEEESLKEKRSKSLLRDKELNELRHVASEYATKLIYTLVPSLGRISKIKDKDARIRAVLKAYLEADWAPRVLGDGHLIIESDGFDCGHFLRLYFRVDERRKWLRKLDEFNKKYMLRKDLRDEYSIVPFEDKFDKLGFQI